MCRFRTFFGIAAFFLASISVNLAYAQTRNVGAVSVVPLVTSDYKGGTYLCSATVIAPNKALTAAHCLYGKGAVRAVSLIAGERYFVSEAVTHPQYFGVVGQNFDVAVVTFDRPLPVPSMPVIIDRVRALQNGTVFQTYGYGVTPFGSAGELKTTAMIFTRNNFEMSHAVFRTETLQGEVPSRPCEGDSGGPALYNVQSGVTALIGVLSYGSRGCGGSSSVYFMSFEEPATFDWVRDYAPEARFIKLD